MGREKLSHSTKALAEEKANNKAELELLQEKLSQALAKQADVAEAKNQEGKILAKTESQLQVGKRTLNHTRELLMQAQQDENALEGEKKELRDKLADSTKAYEE